MELNKYQEEAKKTALYPKVGENYVYPTLGLVGEAGEVAEKVKKIFRDNNGEITEEIRENLKKELGDVLWYLTQVATEINLTLEEIAKFNIEKLSSRMERGKLQGDGDNR